MFKVEPLQTVYEFREISTYICGYQLLVATFCLVNRYVTFLFESTFGKMILPHKKSSILARFYKFKCHWSLFQRKLCILGKYNIRTGKCTNFYRINNGIFCECCWLKTSLSTFIASNLPWWIKLLTVL